MLSAEQQHVVDSLRTHNIIVDAVAGSGKTTTMLQMARQYPQWKFLLLTYNSKLRLEGVEKAKGIPNITIHTFHSFCYQYVSVDCATDSGIIDFIDSKSTFNAVLEPQPALADCGFSDETTAKPAAVQTTKQSTAKKYANGFSDETTVPTVQTVHTVKTAQSLPKPPARKASHIVQTATTGGFSDETTAKTAKPAATLLPALKAVVYDIPKYDVVIIDEAQDMTPLFYKLACRILDGHVVKPHLCVVGDKYQSIYGYAGADSRYITLADRVFPSGRDWRRCDMKTSFRVTRQAAAFVNGLLSCERIKAVKDGPQITYYKTTKDYKALLQGVRSSLAKYKPEDIFVVARSIRGTVINRIATTISKYALVFVPNDDMGRLDDKICKGKIVFSSYHQVKGLERPCVHVLNFDDYYYRHTDEPREVLANTHYVAITRSLETLYIYQCGEPVQFFKNTGLRIIDGAISPFSPETKSAQSVTSLIRHIPSDVLHRIMKHIVVTQIRPPGDLLALDGTSKQGGGASKYAEFVADINGIAINAEFEYARYGQCTALAYLKCPNARMVPLLETSDGKSTLTSIEVAILFTTTQNGSGHRKRQIKQINWGNKFVVQELIKRLDKYVDEKAVFESGFTLNYTTSEKRIVVTGFADMVTETRIIELKATTQLKPEHIIQTVLYAHMHDVKFGVKLRAELYNVCSDELLVVYAEKPHAVIDLLMCNKFHKKTRLSDEEFIAGLETKCADPRCTARK
jgi:hypothetical protein